METEIKSAINERKIVAWRNRVTGSLVFYARKENGGISGKYVVLSGPTDLLLVGVSTPWDEHWFDRFKHELDPIYEGDSVTITF